ncbi:MAG: hypothetical protein LBF15_04975 [Candidatus Peribacteria bacterium]|nr:hypothetical protein [Candidatus Peribacteria bacterium]
MEVKNDIDESFSLYYSKIDKKKSFMINSKKTTLKNFFSKTYTCVVFSPISMNMLYLSPSLRRDFLDDTLKSSFLEYDILLKNYKKVVKERNSVLKAINEGKVNKNEINFWNEKFIELAKKIYVYRLEFTDFLEKNIV